MDQAGLQPKEDLMRTDGNSCFRATLTGVLMVAGMVALPMAVRSEETSTTPSSTTVVPVRLHERHPNIRKAIKKLEVAKEDLQRAPHDFGGHRLNAVHAIDQALAELQLALQFDTE